MSGPVLVTGAQGFAGRWLVAEAALRWPGRSIVGVGRSPARETFTGDITLGSARTPAPLVAALQNLPKNVTYRRADIRDAQALSALLEEVQPSVVVHLASGLRDDPPEVLFPINVEGTIALLRAIARSTARIERIVVGSSGSVYGNPASLPVGEGDMTVPLDLYAVSKVAMEHAARVVARDASLPLVVARIFNVVGPGLDERHACARFASQVAAIAVRAAEPRIVVGDLTPTRDFVDVRDVASALAILCERGEVGRTYNVASGREAPMSAVLETLVELAGLRSGVEIERAYHRVGDTPRVVADIGALAALGYAPRFTLSSSLADLYAYYVGSVAAARSSTPATN